MGFSSISLERPSLETESPSESSRFIADDEKIYPKRSSSHIFSPHWIIHIISFLAWISLLVYSTGKHPRNCLEKFNSYSPILDAIGEDSFKDVRFKYSVWYKSPWKGPPTPEVEEAWYDIMKYGEIRVPPSEILRIRHNLTAVQYPPSIGGGYPAIASGTHALHCLHFLWQDHYVDTIPSASALKTNAPQVYEQHFEHCVDYTRQYLMCKFDPTIIPLYWVKGNEKPIPNGGTWHKCVDWEALQSWLRDRVVEMPEGFEWVAPEDAVRWDDIP
ncbi:hypothetical protein ACMFMG_004088 [Clarireedia jacksonii]